MVDDLSFRAEFRRALDPLAPPAPWLAAGVRDRLRERRRDSRSVVRGVHLGAHSAWLVPAIAVLLALAIVITITLGFHLPPFNMSVPVTPIPKAVHLALCTAQCQVATLPSQWYEAPLPAPASCATGCGLQSFFATPKIGWVFEESGPGRYLYRTDDAGQHWRLALNWMGFPPEQIQTSADGAEALVFTGDTVFHTVDSGAHWTAYGLPVGATTELVPYFSSPREGWWLAPNDDLLQTSDSGAHWFRLGTLAVADRAAVIPGRAGLTFIDSRNGYLIVGPDTAGADSLPPGWNLLVTRDGGVTWEPEPLPRPAGLGSLAEISTAKATFFNALDGVVEIGYCTNGCARVNSAYGPADRDFASTTSDGGKTWSLPVLLPEYPALPGEGTSVFVDKAHWFRIVDDGIPWLIEYTRNGGHNWQELASTPQGGPVHSSSPVWTGAVSVDFIDAAHGWVMSRDRDGTVHLWSTSDSGQTWSELHLPANE